VTDPDRPEPEESGESPPTGSSLRSAGREELARRLAEEGEGWSEGEVLDFLANPFADEELVRSLMSRRSLVSAYRVRRALLLHPKTPQPEALRLVPFLRWRDLAWAGNDPRLSPIVRRSCDRMVLERLLEMALGEKIALARVANRAVIGQLRFDPEPMVFAALLVNPRLVEDDVVSLVTSGRAARSQLEAIARDPRWSSRYAVRLALLRNPASPVGAVVSLLGTLRRDDLLAVWRAPATGELVRRAAKQLLEAKFEAQRGGKTMR
jgi:hypothetical protein